MKFKYYFLKSFVIILSNTLLFFLHLFIFLRPQQPPPLALQTKSHCSWAKKKKFYTFRDTVWHIYFKSLLTKIEWILGCPILIEMLIILLWSAWFTSLSPSLSLSLSIMNEKTSRNHLTILFICLLSYEQKVNAMGTKASLIHVS